MLRTAAHWWGSDKQLPHVRRQSVGVEEGKRTKNREYSEELRRTIEERSLQKKISKENRVEIEKQVSNSHTIIGYVCSVVWTLVHTHTHTHTHTQHVSTFDQHWGQPGAGAPRLNHNGQVDALPKNFASMLETQVHTGWHFRRT